MIVGVYYDDLPDELTEDDDKLYDFNELCDAPEDATFNRDLSDCNKIPELLRIAYVAGYNRDFFEIEYIEEEE